jgi:hypothetical protein
MTRRRTAILLLIALLAVAIGIHFGTRVSAEYRTLSRFAGTQIAWRGDLPKDLADACADLGIGSFPAEPGLLTRLLRKLGLARPEPPGPYLVPAAVHALRDGRILVASHSTVIWTPGAPSVAFHLVSPRGRVGRTGPFDIGWREHGFGTTSVIDPSRVGAPLVVLRAPSTTQHYALLGDRFVLVRLEDDVGKITKNHYGAPNWTVGPSPSRTRDEWLALLRSESHAEVLAALVWLGGVHVNEGPPWPDTVHEDHESAGIWHDLIANEDVKRRLAELVESDDEWTRAAARLATDVETYPRWR